jgi:hypothetical protein
MHPNHDRRNTRSMKISLAQATLFGRTGTPPDPVRLDARDSAVGGAVAWLARRLGARAFLARTVAAHTEPGEVRHG